MACGKPVIATDCGGPADFINKEKRILVPVGDVNEISNAILEMAENIKSYDSEMIRKIFSRKFFKRNSLFENY
jgi:glycosyltransferase involved in cell wall biosynthesis